MVKESGQERPTETSIYWWCLIIAWLCYIVATFLLVFVWLPSLTAVTFYQVVLLFAVGAICNGIGAIIYRMDNRLAMLKPEHQTPKVKTDKGPWEAKTK